jgi:hypothetical protein
MVALTTFIVNAGIKDFCTEFMDSMACRRIVKLRRVLNGPACVGPLAFKAIMTLPQPSAFLALIKGHDGECPCCRRRFADAC